jgi:phage portal protein BeeE
VASVLDLLRSKTIRRRAPTEFRFNGQPYPLAGYQPQSMAGSPVEASVADFSATVRTIHSHSGVVAAAVAARAWVLSQMVFKWRPLRDDGRLFGTPALGPLEHPGRDLTRQTLLTRVEADVAYQGNFYVRRLPDGRLRRLRPDWMQLLIGSDERPEEVRLGADAEVIGYVYKPGGPASQHRGQLLGLSEVAHWAPEPHPLTNFVGEAWVTAVWREIAADMQSTDHVSKFFENAATANMVATAPPEVVTKEQFDEWVAAFDGAHRGVENSWRTVYVQAGTDIKVVGSQIGELRMAELQGGFETRVAARSRVPATVLLIREGMQGSALNAGNYSQTRRLWADSWFTPYAQALCGSVERVLDVPAGAELTFDPSRVLLLQEDQADDAEILLKHMTAIETAVRAGFKPDTILDAVSSGDLTRMEHTGLPSVQVQPSPAPEEPDA